MEFLGFIIQSYNILQLPIKGLIFGSRQYDNIKSTVDAINKIVTCSQFVHKIYLKIINVNLTNNKYLKCTKNYINSGWVIL